MITPVSVTVPRQSANTLCQCDVATMLSKNTDYKNATPYQLLRADIEKLLGTIMVHE